MSDIVIKAENLGKKYMIGHQADRGSYTALRDVLMQNARTLWSKTKDLAMGKPIIQGDTMEEVWALKDVSFEVRRGEAVGIIGRNGAGKSTLLKILSRITEPSTGRVTIKGRVASLLEVGTGFHPELSGRENIYLNGTILGMTRNEIKRKFDEIVSFAEVEKYLDTPVKRYSSGMYVRLAFAVAAHLEPEILVVDEVLAVGDAAFQKKCLGKMGDVAKEGRTVLFVSHNMAAINAICGKAILLNHGIVDDIGLPQRIIDKYLASFQDAGITSLDKRKDRVGNGNAKLKAIYISNSQGVLLDEILSGQECMLNIVYESTYVINKPIFVFTIYNQHCHPIAHCNSSVATTFFDRLDRQGVVACNFKKFPLSKGIYRLNVAILDGGQVLDHIESAFSFLVDDGDYFGTGRVIQGINGVCLIDHSWRSLELDSEVKMR